MVQMFQHLKDILDMLILLSLVKSGGTDKVLNVFFESGPENVCVFT